MFEFLYFFAMPSHSYIVCHWSDIPFVQANHFQMHHTFPFLTGSMLDYRQIDKKQNTIQFFIIAHQYWMFNFFFSSLLAAVISWICYCYLCSVWCRDHSKINIQSCDSMWCASARVFVLIVRSADMLWKVIPSIHSYWS